MNTPDEKTFFLEHGYLHVPGVVSGTHLRDLQATFDTVWDREGAPVNQHKLLKYEPFLELIAHPPILERQQAIFGRQTQLLQYDLLRQGPHSDFPNRAWHRDFVFPGDTPLSVNTLLFLDDITETVGPTRIVPDTHRGTQSPPREQRHEPLLGELAVPCAAGDAIFINSAIWHTGGRNEGDGLRRGIYLYYGYWWLKRYEANQALPWQALQNADDTRLQLLGLRNPGSHDLHQYTP